MASGGGDAPAEGEAKPDGDPSSDPVEAETTTTTAAADGGGDGGEEGGGVEMTGDGSAGEGEEGREGTDKDAPIQEDAEDVSQEKKIEDGAEVSCCNDFAA